MHDANTDDVMTIAHTRTSIEPLCTWKEFCKNFRGFQSVGISSELHTYTQIPYDLEQEARPHENVSFLSFAHNLS